MVLGYRVSGILLCQIAYHDYYKNKRQRESLIDGLSSKKYEKRLASIHRGVVDAVLYLSSKSNVPIKLFTQCIITEDDDYSFVLAFCSSKPMKEDPAFHIDEVRPQDKVDDILDFAKLIYHSNILPHWTIPDDAVKLTYQGVRLYKE